MERTVLGGSKQGVWQRASGSSLRRCELAQYLYGQHCWGCMSLPQVQRIAELASREILAVGAAVPKELHVLATLGDSSSSHNMRRDLERRCAKPWLPVTWHDVPVILSGTSTVAERKLAFFEPYLVFLEVQERQTDVFRSVICPSTDSIQQFWSEVGSHPALVHHPVRKIDRFDQRAIPVVLHGDGVPVSGLLGAQQRSCCFVSWRSLLCRESSSKRQHFLLTAIWSQQIAKSQTLDSLYSVVCSSFDGMLHDAAAGKIERFLLPVFCTGDLEWFSLAHGLPRWNSRQPCGCCAVQRQNMFHFQEVAEVSEDPWDDSVPARCELFRRTMSTKSILPDLMHTKHLGVDQKICGSVIWMLAHEIWPDTVQENLHRVLAEMKAWCSEQRLPGLNSLTPGMYLGKLTDPGCTQHYPSLKAKAAETKVTVQALAAVFQVHMDQSDELHVLTHLTLKFSTKIDSVLAETAASWHPTDSQCEDLHAAAVGMLQCMTRLTKENRQQKNRCLFQLTFKGHWLIHCMQLCRHISPVHCWCYSGEDYMSKCKTLLRSCLCGRKPLPALQRFAEQYARASCFEFRQTSLRSVIC